MGDKSNKRYTLNQIKLIVESGKASTLPIFVRQKIRYILHSNIEALDYYSKNEKLSPELRNSHRNEATNLKNCLTHFQIPHNRKNENTNNKTARYSNTKAVY